MWVPPVPGGSLRRRSRDELLETFQMGGAGCSRLVQVLDSSYFSGRKAEVFEAAAGCATSSHIFSFDLIVQ